MNFLASPTETFIAPSVAWVALLPIIIVLGGAVIGVLIEAFVPNHAGRRLTNVIWSAIVILAAFFVTVVRWPGVLANAQVTGEYIDDTLTVAIQACLLVVAFFALLVMADRTVLKDGAFAAQPADRVGSGEESLSISKGYQRSEIFPLMLFSLGGMMMFPATESLLTMFVALEVMSLPLYILTATARNKRLLSQEAAFKYFLLGAFSSAFFLMGAAFLYGYSGGSVEFGTIAGQLPTANNMEWILVTGVFFVMVGLLFKVAAFPFHAWTPDVYTGAPTPVTGFMAAGVKMAAFGGMLRFYQIVAGHLQWDYRIIFGIIAAGTIILGTVAGLQQKNIKRMLAYSSIAHAGFILIGVLALAPGSATSVVFYTFAYAIATVGAFGAITLVRSKDAEGNIGSEANSISAWRGLGRTNPLIGTSMLIFLLSMAGIPFTSGFVAKFLVFAQGIRGGYGWLVGIALAASAVTAVFYFRLIQTMFLKKPTDRTAVVESEGYADVVVFLTAVLTVVMGVFPQPIISLLASIGILVP